MKPNTKLISLKDNPRQIIKLLEELVLTPRVSALKWSAITKQTPNIKIGYPGQHLASLITGMCGERTGARGNDLIDGSEVKSCSRIDQLDVCKKCGASVARSEETCSACDSTDIIRKDDSKWLFTIRSESDLRVLLQDVNRIVLLMGDYPRFGEAHFSTLRFQAFEIWTRSTRNARFAELMKNYYRKIYLAHKKNNVAKTPAPKNFWPFSYQFYLCNPIPVFECIVTSADANPKIHIENYVEPHIDRSKIESVHMPVELLKDPELGLILKKARPQEIQKCLVPGARLKGMTVDRLRTSLKYIDEQLRSYLPLRDTDRISIATKAYARRVNES